MMRRSWFTPIAMVVMTGCVASSGGCPATACDSSVFFMISGVDGVVDRDLEVHACVDSVCIDQTIKASDKDYAEISVPITDSAPRAASASIRVTQGRKVLSDGSMPIEIHKLTPEGDPCSQVCYGANLKATDQGLELLPPSDG